MATSGDEIALSHQRQAALPDRSDSAAGPSLAPGLIALAGIVVFIALLIVDALYLRGGLPG